MGTTHGAEELGLCPHGHACQAAAWGRYIGFCLRVDLNCIVSYLTHCLLVSWLILLCKIRNLAGRPSIQYNNLEIVLFVWQNGKSWYKCRFRFFFFYRMVDPMANFPDMVFLITLPKCKNDRQDLKKWAVRMRLDVSYDLCSKLGSKLIF
jgi:hypothetical protein